jgi:signal transduction histidine kinase
LNNLLRFIHQGDQQELMNRVQRTMSEFVPYEMDVRIIRPTGEQRYLQAQGEAVTGEDGKAVGMVGTVLDITERKREEDALQHLVSLLEEKSRALELTTAEQQSFIYSVSHDLRSPLISIQGMAEIIQTDHADTLDETAQQYLGRILANVRRLQDMLSGLLELSRIGRTENSSRHGVDLQPLVLDIIDGLRDSQAWRDAEIDIEDELPTVWAHSSRMSQLFTNLLDNALKYTPPDQHPRVAVRTEDFGDTWRISVSDNGIGIPSEHRNSAVSMFSRLTQGQRLNPGGSGLGLAIVSRIVAIYGGVLTIESVECEGATISFTLPKM